MKAVRFPASDVQDANAFWMRRHGATKGVHAQLVKHQFIADVQGVLFNAEQGFESFLFGFTSMKGHDRLAQSKQQPAFPMALG